MFVGILAQTVYGTCMALYPSYISQYKHDCCSCSLAKYLYSSLLSLYVGVTIMIIPHYRLPIDIDTVLGGERGRLR